MMPPDFGLLVAGGANATVALTPLAWFPTSVQTNKFVGNDGFGGMPMKLPPKVIVYVFVTGPAPVDTSVTVIGLFGSIALTLARLLSAACTCAAVAPKSRAMVVELRAPLFQLSVQAPVGPSEVVGPVTATVSTTMSLDCAS